MWRFSGIRLHLFLRNHLLRQQQILSISSISSSFSTLIPSLRNGIPSPSYLTPGITFTIPAAASLSSSDSIGLRTYSSDSDLPSNMVLISSEKQLNDSLKKVEDESLPAVFYFTAVWCGPCRFIWPEIKTLSKTLPDVKFYKIDIDEVGSGPTLSHLSIFSVPTLHFFKDGKKAAEVVGADAKKIKNVSSSLYTSDSAE